LPFDPLIEEYFNREGLHETHLHLNGSTHAELCWLRAITEPEKETNDFCNKYNDTQSNTSRLRELARAVHPDFSISSFRNQLHVAKQLRKYLISAAFGCLSSNEILPKNCENLLSLALSNYEPTTSRNEPEYNKFILYDNNNIVSERYWIFLLLKILDSKPSVSLTNMLHCYLILQNLYYRLLVQNEEQYGFDQFQKITWTDLREPVEKDYFDRFQNMHGSLPTHSRVVYLEGRFAPKDLEKKNVSILYNILSGYWRYLYKTNPASDLTLLLGEFEKNITEPSIIKGRYLKLALVAHFVKLPETTVDIPYRHYTLRTKLTNQVHTLKNTLEHYPSLKLWFRGIDAAANELDAPPEVFASVYRMCRHSGITHRSYHAGEDFHHILSGIRAMFDALELLGLCEGDRIGHGTAMGISPELWLKRMPGGVYIRKDDWLLDLLSTWRLLKTIGETGLAYKLEAELTELGSDLFGQQVNSIKLERVMKLRGLNIEFLAKIFASIPENINHSELPKSVDAVTPLSDIEMTEALKVDEAVSANFEDCRLLWKWLSDPEIRSRGRQLKFVDAEYLSAAEYIKVQQALMRVVKDRKVLIETLPSSNVRISQYESFDEHHVFRWMGISDYVHPGDPEIMVTLGSDDPGIFAGDLAGEFYQLYAVLQGLGLSDKKALHYISELNERGREYRFHDFRIG
jgi:adenosine deaminase